MSDRSWIPVRDVMRTDVTEVDGKIDVLSALKIMKKVGATSLIVKRRDEQDEYGMLLFSDVAKKVIAKDRARSARTSTRSWRNPSYPCIPA